jgi:hypothetical protein
MTRWLTTYTLISSWPDSNKLLLSESCSIVPRLILTQNPMSQVTVTREDGMSIVKALSALRQHNPRFLVDGPLFLHGHMPGIWQASRISRIHSSILICMDWISPSYASVGKRSWSLSSISSSSWGPMFGDMQYVRDCTPLPRTLSPFSLPCGAPGVVLGIPFSRKLCDSAVLSGRQEPEPLSIH